MARFRGPVLVILIVIGILTLGDSLWTRVSAIVPCVNPDTAGARNAWPTGAINVNISGFPTALQPCVKSAFDNWNTSNQTSSPNGNGTGVRLQPVFDGPTLATGTTGGTNVYQVTYGPTYDSNGSVVNVLGSTHDTASSSGTSLKNAKTEINSNITNCTAVTQTMAHEIGHTMGAGECSKCTQPQQSVMIPGKCAASSGGICIVPDWNDTTYGLPGPTTCDNTVVHTVYNPPPPNPACSWPCKPGYKRDPVTCQCVISNSPIILDLNGQGFHLTSAENGVSFDISGTGTPLQMAWTASGADNAFLALPGADGLVHNGKQLFGNFTPQPVSDNPNGFIALAVYDENGDGIIDSRDSIYASLRLWTDVNHDGISQPDELHTLPSLGVNSISLKYKESKKTDQYGNVFRYRARVNGNESQDVGQTAYDVFFVTLSQPTSKNIPRSLIPADAQKCADPLPTKGGMLSSTGTL